MKEHTYPLKMDHIAAGVCYYPEHWGETYWKKDLQLMKELGLETARVGEFAWNFFEPREGVYDFALFDRFLDEAKEAGVKIIFCTPTCTPPAWLSRRYPETLNTTIEGNPYRHGMRQHHNMTSPVYLEKCDRLIEAMASHFGSHPAIIGWCPFNETWGYREEREKNALLSSIYKLTKRLDPTRPCIDSSGNYRVISEVYDIHDYDQNTESFLARYNGLSQRMEETGGVIPAEDPFFNSVPEAPNGRPPFFNQPYEGQPVFISEYGGIRWPDETVAGWGYGNAPTTPEEYFARYRGLTEALLNNPDICGFCYTQLYDVEQEVNGLYTYGRKEKFDIQIIREINQQKAAIEE